MIIGISIFLTFAYIFSALVYAITADQNLGVFLIIALSILATVLLYKYPEWYVIDSLGILIAAGVAAIFGSSLEWYLVVLLLVLLVVYDAISVYKTKHMIKLAEGVIDLKTPILFVIPKKRDYPFIRDGIGKLDDGGERAAFFIGMGDLIMPWTAAASPRRAGRTRPNPPRSAQQTAATHSVAPRRLRPAGERLRRPRMAKPTS